MGLVRPLRTVRVILVLLITAMICLSAHGKVIYVDADATGANGGTSWANAYVYLQDALADANDSDKPVEIRVAQGTYKPDQGVDQTLGDRQATFLLISGVKLRGGFAGSVALDPNVRDVELHVTILSGDLNSDDVEVVNPDFLADEPSRAENSYHVVTGRSTDETAVMEGFVITGGNADGPLLGDEDVDKLRLQSGGGMNNWGSSPALADCTFTRNSASYGGGMRNSESTPTLTNCTFSRNLATSGGGMLNENSRPTLTRCAFSGNSALRLGGGMLNENSDPSLANCTLSGNSAVTGGGISNYASSPTLTNCTFAQNSAEYGSALVCNSLQGIPSNVELINCILWDRGDEIWRSDDSTITTRYSNIQGGFPGQGNVNVDAGFANPGYWDPNGTPANPNDDFWRDGDYHLKSETGRWDPNSESWVQDEVTSPCLDAGDPNSDWSGETWPHGERINMGAYGGTRQASMSLQAGGMSLPRVAYIFSHKTEVAESFQSLLGSYGCPTTLIRRADVAATPLDTYDLVIVANDTRYETTWSDPNTVAAIEDSGKPVVGLGDGGYDFYGLLGLSIGSPNGGHGSKNSIEAIDPNSSLFSTPYHIEIPRDRVLQLYTETKHVGLYFWPTIPETVTVLGREVNDVGFFPLAMEHDRYLLWGFAESPQKMTEVGKRLFLNIVIRTANRNWGS